LRATKQTRDIDAVTITLLGDERRLQEKVALDIDLDLSKNNHC
jgi:hypothetical protein